MMLDLHKFTKPFNENRWIFFLILFLLTFSDTIQCLSTDCFKYLVYILAHGFCASYILTFVFGILPRKVRNVSSFLIYTTIWLFFILDLVCATIFESFFDVDISAIIVGTNFMEIKEFIVQFIKWYYVLLFLVFTVLYIFLLDLLHKRTSPKSRRVYSYIGFGLLFCSSLLSWHNKDPWKDILFGEIYMLLDIPYTPDLQEYSGAYEIEKLSTSPTNIVVIFGESFSKEHSSLYNYQKKTNPYLEKLRNDSSLLVFDKVRSSGLNTISSFKAMMSVYRTEYGDSCKWYECLSLPEVIGKSGYNSTWISNQSKKGLFDNLIGKYADLCDTSFWVGNKFAGMKRKDLDEEVLPLLYRQPVDSLNFLFVHLMGSHSVFRNRYPSSFNKFTDSDYKDYPKSQRKILAEYDNSILYNDSIVYQIIKQFSKKETILFYFSDHGLDVFNSSEDYIGHGKKNIYKSAEAGYKIPFMIYFSDLYLAKYPQIYQKLRSNLHKPYSTEDLIYTIMDVMGCRFKDNDDVAKYSLLR